MRFNHRGVFERITRVAEQRSHSSPKTTTKVLLFFESTKYFDKKITFLLFAGDEEFRSYYKTRALAQSCKKIHGDIGKTGDIANIAIIASANFSIAMLIFPLLRPLLEVATSSQPLEIPYSFLDGLLVIQLIKPYPTRGQELLIV